VNGATAVPRVMLMVGGRLERSTAGSVFVRDLCEHYPSDRLSHLVLVDRLEGPLEKQWLGSPIRYIRDPCQQAQPRLRGRWKQLAASPLRGQLLKHRLRSCLSQAQGFAKQHHAELVWAILNRPSTILLARRLASALPVPLVVTVWDPPEYLAENYRLDALERRRLLREFERTLRAAARCAVASEGMRDEYRQRYGVDGIVHIHAVRPELRRLPANGPRSAGRLIIGVAGNLYAKREWDALLAALSAHHWRIAGRQVVVRVLSSGIRAAADGGACIEYLGWRPPEETIDLLAEVDLAYLPYWFDWRHRLSVRLCFPNKLSTYLAAGIPVLFHGPEDSSVARFFQRYPAGICCHSLDKGQIVASLERLASDGHLYSAAAAAGQAALDQELNLTVFLDRFAMLLGIDRRALLPAAAMGPQQTAPVRLSGHPAGMCRSCGR
jgi:hypothetical protein